MMNVLAFLVYALVFALPSLAVAVYITVITKIDTKYMYYIWIALTIIFLWSFDIHLLLLETYD